MERRKTHWPTLSSRVKRPTAVGLLTICFCLMGLSLALRLSSPPMALAEKSPTDNTFRVPTALAKPPASTRLTLRGIIEKGETAVSIFHQAGIDTSQVLALCQAVREVYDL